MSTRTAPRPPRPPPAPSRARSSFGGVGGRRTGGSGCVAGGGGTPERRGGQSLVCLAPCRETSGVTRDMRTREPARGESGKGTSVTKGSRNLRPGYKSAQEYGGKRLLADVSSLLPHRVWVVTTGPVVSDRSECESYSAGVPNKLCGPSPSAGGAPTRRGRCATSPRAGSGQDPDCDTPGAGIPHSMLELTPHEKKASATLSKASL